MADISFICMHLYYVRDRDADARAYNAQTQNCVVAAHSKGVGLIVMVVHREKDCSCRRIHIPSMMCVCSIFPWPLAVVVLVVAVVVIVCRRYLLLICTFQPHDGQLAQRTFNH